MNNKPIQNNPNLSINLNINLNSANIFNNNSNSYNNKTAARGLSDLFPENKKETVLQDKIVEQKPYVKKEYRVPKIVGDYKYYRIFNGCFNILNDGNYRKLDNTQLFSCSKAHIVSKCDQINEIQELNMNITKSAFESYVDRILSEKHRGDYFVLPAWVMFSGNMKLSAKVKYEIKHNEVIASYQYSEKSKIFVFPKEYLKPKWLERLDFTVMNKDFDLLCFIVHKNNMNASTLPKIIPEPMPIEANRAYKLINSDNKIKDKPINVEILKEFKSNQYKNNKMNYPQSCKPELNNNVTQFANGVTENIDINNLLGILKSNNILSNGFNNKPNNNFATYNNRQNFGQRPRNDSISMNNSKSIDNSLEYYNSRESSLEMMNRSRESSIEIPHNRNKNQSNLMQQQKMIYSNNLYNNKPQNSKNNLLGYLGNNSNNYDILKRGKRNFTQIQSRAEPVNFTSNLVKRNPQSRQPVTNDNRLMSVLGTNNVKNNQADNLMSQQQ